MCQMLRIGIRTANLAKRPLEIAISDRVTRQYRQGAAELVSQSRSCRKIENCSGPFKSSGGQHFNEGDSSLMVKTRVMGPLGL